MIKGGVFYLIVWFGLCVEFVGLFLLYKKYLEIIKFLLFLSFKVSSVGGTILNVSYRERILGYR